ncbi:MAG: hypothetical protein J0H50_08195, partial [Xanthomonadales bacterium]|nr:hypothetical protein [Xanthomonadales bacterium]
MRKYGISLGALALGVLLALGAAPATLAQDSHAAQDGPLEQIAQSTRALTRMADSLGRSTVP